MLKQLKLKNVSREKEPINNGRRDLKNFNETCINENDHN